MSATNNNPNANRPTNTRHTQQDNWDAAVDLFQQLKSNQLGVRPNSVTYNILMLACLARDRPQNVSTVLRESVWGGFILLVFALAM